MQIDPALGEAVISFIGCDKYATYARSFEVENVLDAVATRRFFRKNHDEPDYLPKGSPFSIPHNPISRLMTSIPICAEIPQEMLTIVRLQVVPISNLPALRTSRSREEPRKRLQDETLKHIKDYPSRPASGPLKTLWREISARYKRKMGPTTLWAFHLFGPRE